MAEKFKRFMRDIFPSDVDKGEIGSVNLNIWLAQITGVPIIGLKHESNWVRNIILIYGIFITTVVTFIYTGFEIYDLYMNWHDLDSLTQNTCLSLTHISGAIKTVNLILRLPRLRGVIRKLKHVTKTYIKSEKQLLVFYDGEVENKLVLSIYIGIVAFTGFMGMIMLYMNPEAVAGKIFPYRVILPSWMPQQLQLLYMGLSVIIFAIQIIAVDYLNVTIINQIRFQLNILNLAFDDLIVETQTNPRETRHLVLYKDDPVRRMNAIVEHHCLLRELRQDTEDIFSQPILWQFMTSVIIFAMTGFQATVRSSGSSAAVLIYAYCGCIFCELFVYCWFGNEVSEQSKTIGTSGFHSSWYSFDRRYGKSLLIFLTNAQRPFVFTAGGFMGLSLPSFTGILSKSYSYIALLRQIYGN
ncbi:odorant receptor 85b-like [Musca vetustissima]|uniref:odorant receptor 85b-like n=2 Tax=Musca vetustissima TaxID=27455 RepID=UPI002AB67078|nr:odorant receptor 85b-like [Musca vetustissima]